MRLGEINETLRLMRIILMGIPESQVYYWVVMRLMQTDVDS